MRKIFAVAFVAMCASGCVCLTDKCAMERLPKGSVLLDVRGAEEYNVAHIKGAINIPHTKVAERIGAVVSDKSAPIFIYCRSGKRANMARESLSKLGYTNIINLGGFNDAKKSLD